MADYSARALKAADKQGDLNAGHGVGEQKSL